MVTYEGWEVLKGVRLRESGAVAKHKADFDDPCRARSHQRVTEDSVDHGAEFEVLGVSAHCPSGHEDDNSRQEVSTRPPAAVSA